MTHADIMYTWPWFIFISRVCVQYAVLLFTNIRIANHCILFEYSTAVNCPALPNPENGGVSLSGITPGSTVTYDCNAGYSLIGERTRMCLPSGEWSGSAPTCKRERRSDSVVMA